MHYSYTRGGPKYEVKVLYAQFLFIIKLAKAAPLIALEVQFLR